MVERKERRRTSLRLPQRGEALLLLMVVGVGSLVACGGGSGTGGGGGLVSTLPTWVSVSWTGGALGNPNDRRDVEATEWQGGICPATHLVFDYNGSTLNFQNNCNIPVTYAICLTKGSLEGTGVCSPDPLNTSSSSLRFTPLNPGNLGDFLNASGNLSINFFYCSDQATIVGGPVRCLQSP